MILGRINYRESRRCLKGFTLFEALIVISMISLVATLAFPSAMSAIKRSQEAALKGTLLSTRIALDDYYSDHGKYPRELAVLVEKRYLRAVPYDPIEKTTEWEEEYYKDGIIDIHSRSSAISLSETQYRDW